MARRRVAFLHGFTQTHHSWHRCARSIAHRLDGPTTLVFPDLPGHGLSSDDRSGIADAATELATSIGRSSVVGYSMGGRTALHLALSADRRIDRLVLIGATPGLEDPDDRRARADADDRRAARIELIGVDAFLDEWLAAPLFATLPPDEAGRADRRRNTTAGLAHSLRTAGTGTQASLWDRLDDIDVPVLVLAGELDAKFTQIGRSMTERIPLATFRSVPGAGHAAHTEQPEATAELIADWWRTGT